MARSDSTLLHRDVKPATILLTAPEKGKQRILLADYGIARSLDDISGLTATNTTVGTFTYTAPEQLMDAPVDGRANQYSLAASAYHLLADSRRSSIPILRSSSAIISTQSRGR